MTKIFTADISLITMMAKRLNALQNW